MKIILAHQTKEQKNIDLLVMGVFKKDVAKTKPIKDNISSNLLEIDANLHNLDKQMEGFLLSAAHEEGFKAEEGQIYSTATLGKIKVRRIAMLGLGNIAKQHVDLFRKSGAEAYRLAQARQAQTLCYLIPKQCSLPLFDVIQAITEGLKLASYRFDKYLTKEKHKNYVKEVEIVLTEAISADKKIALERGLEIASGVLLARDLINEGPSVLNPQQLAKHATELAKDHKNLSVNVLNETQLRKEKMALLLAVGSASESVAPPRLIRIAYKPKKPKARVMVLVGKGVTFDSGGLNIKPADGMLDMKVDMSGAAAVLGIMRVIAKLEPKIQVIGYLACVENGISAASYHQGDIITSRKGLTVEITNTDAEGRLIMADVISYAIDKDNPDTLIDLATLTGACMVALGRNTAGLFSNDEDLSQSIRNAGKAAGEAFWPMPLSEDLKEQLKTPIADLKNCGDRYGGAITAALFLQQFISEGLNWAHLDIAGPATNTKSHGYHSVGAEGFGVRTLVDYIMAQS